MFESTDALAHVIQVGLTPAFLLAGLATMLNVFSTRLGRVSDRVDTLAGAVQPDVAAEAWRRLRLRRLMSRSQLLDAATALASAAGVGIVLSVAALFAASLSGSAAANWSFWLFVAALVCVTGALLLFTCEVLMAGRDLRAAAALDRRGDGGAAIA